VGRWADDQFLVILNGCREEVLPPVRERVRHLLSGDGIEWWGERRSLPVSIGNASARVDDSVESLIERLQKSLETASAWRSRCASASSEMAGS
jgi:GGDEF domain-containing protein